MFLRVHTNKFLCRSQMCVWLSPRGESDRPESERVLSKPGSIRSLSLKSTRRSCVLLPSRIGERDLRCAANTNKLVDEQIAILKEEGVHPSTWIWVHAQNMTEPADFVKAAKADAWIKLDGARDELMDRHLSYVKTLKEAGFLSQILLSHDGNSVRLTGLAPKAYEQLFTTFISLSFRGRLYKAGDQSTY